MQEQFIPYEQAVELKELGFDEECFACYTENGFDLQRERYFKFSTNSYIKNKLDNIGCSAPLWQQVFDWFRVWHGLFSYISGFLNSSDTFYYKIFGHSTEITINVEPSSYEEARLECLKRLIEIVK